MRVLGAFQSGVDGIRKASESMDRAAAEIAHVSVELNGPDPVDLSEEARARGADGGDPIVSGIELPIVDLRVAKYVAVANMAVIRTADEMTEELAKLAGRRER